MASRRERHPLVAMLRHVDVALIGATVALALIGVVTVYSATRSQYGHYYLERQAIWVVLGMVIMVAVALVDYRRLAAWGYPIYGLVVISLIGVFVAGKSASDTFGAQRWYQLGPLQLQPSEFAALGLIIAIATYCSRRQGVLRLREMVGILVLAAVPLVLVYKQPDLGTTIILGVCLAAMMVAANVRARYLALLFVTVVGGFVAAIHLHLLDQYQLDRLTNFLHQNSNLSGGNYDLYLSKVTISSGGLHGTGLFRGRLDEPRLRPEPGDGLHLLGDRRAARLRGYGPCDRAVRRRVAADPSRRTDGPGQLRPSRLRRRLRLPCFLGVREHRDDDRAHADHGHPAAVHQLRRLGLVRILRYRRSRGQRGDAPGEPPVSEVDAGSDPAVPPDLPQDDGGEPGPGSGRPTAEEPADRRAAIEPPIGLLDGAEEDAPHSDPDQPELVESRSAPGPAEVAAPGEGQSNEEPFRSSLDDTIDFIGATPAPGFEDALGEAPELSSADTEQPDISSSQLLFVDVLIVLPSSNPVVVLQEADAPYRELRIPIGGAEGVAIGYAARRIATPRPLTHELMSLILRDFDLTLEVVRITGSTGSSFTAEIVVSGLSGTRTIDCRPSDAIALALRQRLPVPIVAAPGVLEQAGSGAAGSN